MAKIVRPLRDVNVHSLRDVSVKGGVIVAWGQTDIDDPASELHHRHAIGVTSRGRYHSVDPGKFTMAPFSRPSLLIEFPLPGACSYMAPELAKMMPDARARLLHCFEAAAARRRDIGLTYADVPPRLKTEWQIMRRLRRLLTGPALRRFIDT